MNGGSIPASPNELYRRHMRSVAPPVYTEASNPVLRWLTGAGRQVQPQIQERLLSELFAGLDAVLMAMLNALAIAITGYYLGGGQIFLVFMLIEVTLSIARAAIVRSTARAAAQGVPTPTDLYLLTAILWCALQGSISFAAMTSGTRSLQLIAATYIMALIGPVCARYFPAPRLTMLLVCLCDFPFIAGCILTNDRWLLVTAAQTPLFLFALKTIVVQLRGMSIALLEAQAESRQRAERDALTGLFNRAGLVKALADMQPAATCQFTLFYLDLDGFKSVNDTYGHPAGDALLKEVAVRLSASVRATDTVARLGGDEFVVVACNLPPAESSGLAESIIRRVTDQQYELGADVRARVGVSVGFACSPEDGDTLDVLQKRADAALYDAKRAGKGVQRRASALVDAPAAAFVLA